MEQQTIAITATFTAEPLEEVLAFWMSELAIPARIRFAPYNQVFQQLLDPGSLLAQNQHGVNVVLIRLEDWQRFETATNGAHLAWPSVAEKIQHNCDNLAAVLQAVTQRSAVPYIICLCPPSPQFNADPRRADLLRRIEQDLSAQLRGQSRLYLMTVQELIQSYTVADAYDPHGDALGHIPYTASFFASLGTALARKIHRLWTAPHKVIVVDCDDTLWRGICGEVGPFGVELDPPRRILQEFLVEQHDAGMLLCLCSKNNEADVLEVFDRRPEMPLQRRHLVAHRINWQSKSANLQALAHDLQLSLDSFIFLDDNPMECAEVQAACPEVLTLQLPQPVDRLPGFLKHLWAFDHAKVTEVDRKRTEMYRQGQERDQLRRQALTLADFLAGLGLEVQIRAMLPEHLDRVAQLTERTNQFNFTTVRRSETAIQQLYQTGELECCVVEVRDRFGDYGLVGVLLFREQKQSLEVDTFLLSCRVLGRGVEYRMLNYLGQLAQTGGLRGVDIRVVPTKKNQPAREFLEAVGAGFGQSVPEGMHYRLPVEHACQAVPRQALVDSAPDETPPKQEPAADCTTPAAQARAQLFTRIATELTDPAQVLRAVAAWRAKQTAPATPVKRAPYAAPRTPVEQAVAEVFGEVLGQTPIGIHDNFFLLGGDSLRGTQVVARLRQAFAIELVLRSLFDAPTVASFAVTILEHLAARSESEEVVALLEDLEQAPKECALSRAMED
jgi:FkbH-like protein